MRYEVRIKRLIPNAIKRDRGITSGNDRRAEGAWKVSDDASGAITRNIIKNILDFE